jgi:hypothetical protein
MSGFHYVLKATDGRFVSAIDVAWIRLTEKPSHAKRYRTVTEAKRGRETAKLHSVAARPLIRRDRDFAI